MKKIALFIFFSVISFTVSAQNKALEAKIRGLDSLDAVAFIAENYVMLDKLWASDFKVNNPRNSISQSAAEVKGMLKAGKIKHVSLERHVEQVFIEQDMAITMGHEFVKNTAESKPFKRRYTNIWLKKDGEWKLSFRHANIICEN
ncbi:MAG: nuclear transport factor 2 family protein [Verrucomicrobia bacterium]|nr:nuclear transport factor 2 family protein [Cytophagales bacterium]